MQFGLSNACTWAKPLSATQGKDTSHEDNMPANRMTYTPALSRSFPARLLLDNTSVSGKDISRGCCTKRHRVCALSKGGLNVCRKGNARKSWLWRPYTLVSLAPNVQHSTLLHGSLGSLSALTAFWVAPDDQALHSIDWTPEPQFFRTRLKRLARRTLCFSKSIEVHDKAIGEFINRTFFHSS